MTLNGARKFYNTFKLNYPEKVFSLSVNVDLSDNKLGSAILLAEQFWLSENISEESAFEKALICLIKNTKTKNNKQIL